MNQSELHQCQTRETMQLVPSERKHGTCEARETGYEQRRKPIAFMNKNNRSESSFLPHSQLIVSLIKAMQRIINF